MSVNDDEYCVRF